MTVLSTGISRPVGGIIGPSTNEEDMDDGTDNSSESASVRDRMLYKNETSLKTDGTESSFTYFKCTKGKASAVSCTFAYAAAAYESSSNNGSQLTYGNPSVQYWRNKSGIKYSLTYNATSSSSLPLPYYDGTFCYVKSLSVGARFVPGYMMIKRSTLQPLIGLVRN